MINKKKFKLSALVLFIFILFGCSKDDSSDNDLAQYTGNYEIISFRSNVAVDLNDDGISSQELTSEINSFDFNDLEIRPLDYQTNKAKLVSFFFPKTWITFQYPSSPEGFVEFLSYGFVTTYLYKNGSFSLEDKTYIEASYIDNVPSDKNVTILSDLDVVDMDHLKLSISKEYYDFNTNDWVMLDIEVLYQKR